MEFEISETPMSELDIIKVTNAIQRYTHKNPASFSMYVPACIIVASEETQRVHFAKKPPETSIWHGAIRDALRVDDDKPMTPQPGYVSAMLLAMRIQIDNEKIIVVAMKSNDFERIFKS